jgi:uncharacterized protein (DUF1810 family)
MSDIPDPHRLQRFVAAQNPVFAQVCAELDAGAKTSHWMWFIFPQLKALGRSATALHYGLADANEALAYWQHPVLGPRLKDAFQRLLAVHGRSAREILGPVDARKLGSCATLFARVAPQEPVFREVLWRYCEGTEDALTLAALG